MKQAFKYTLIRKHFCADCGADADLKLVQRYTRGVEIKLNDREFFWISNGELTLCGPCLEERKVKEGQND